MISDFPKKPFVAALNYRIHLNSFGKKFYEPYDRIILTIDE